nr:uncharacterized protein LOC123748930 [Procambarus clarkii]
MSHRPQGPLPSVSTTPGQSGVLTRTRSYPRTSSSWDIHATGWGDTTGPGGAGHHATRPPPPSWGAGTSPKQATAGVWDTGVRCQASVRSVVGCGREKVDSSAPRGRFAPPIGSKCLTLGRSASFVLRPLTRRLTQGVLVQEVDEGQPCLMCRDKCPGYTSHVWR